MSEQATAGKINVIGEDRAAQGAPADFVAGEALIQPALNRISVHGHVTQVEPKVMQVLMLMASRPGAVISREIFLDTVWAGTLGDDYLLNRAVSELRKILDDDAQSPRYIETIRKSGYRLVAPIAPARVAAAVATPAPPATEPAPPASVPPAAARDRRALYALVAAGIALAGIAAVLLLRPWQGDGVARGYEVLPLTSYVGREVEPALSPDGSRVAFIGDGVNGAFDLYVKTVGNEDVLNLTRSPEAERFPLWSADGRSLLFARMDTDGVAIMRVSTLGGGLARLFTVADATDIRGMSLSPDGTQLAYASRASTGSSYRITLAALDGSNRRIVSNPPPGKLGDIDPRFAPDGHALVFARAVNEVTKDLYRTDLNGREPARLTFDNRKINGLAWSPDGERLLFTSSRAGMYGLWSAKPDGSDLQPVALGSENVHQPATATGVEAIAFEQWTHRSRLRQIDLHQRAEPDAASAVESTRWDSNPAWSPDGERIAFASNRSGPHAIWVSRRDGHGAVQIANFGGAFIDNPAWSPDGKLIAFDGSPDGQVAIYTVPPEGGTPRRITSGPGDSRNPSWSRNGAWLYFESNRSGEWRIHAQPTAGAPVAVTAGPGINARESADGKHLLYNKPDAPGLWRQAKSDLRNSTVRSEALLIADLQPEDAGRWAPASTGIYYVRRTPDGTPSIALFDAGGASTTDLVALPPTFEGWGFELSPDETRLIFSEVLARESDLRLAVPR